MAHLKGHDKYRCKLCKKDFSSKKKLKNHKNTEHDPSTGQTKTQKSSNNKGQTAGKNENFTCIVCLQSYKSEALFKGHDCSKEAKAKEKKANAKDVTMKLGPGRFKCKFCDFEHRKCSAVVRHARMHKNKKRFVCELCGSAFNAHYTLKEHRAYVHSNDRKYSCGKCGKTFKAKNALIRHEQVHSETRPHKCQSCGQEYKRLSHLRRHLVTSHQGAEKDTARYWEDTGGPTLEPRYRPPSSGQEWADVRESSGAPRTSAAISATAALAVVTTLDLNMRNEGKAVKEVKGERGVASGSYPQRPDPSEATYSLPDVRSDVSSVYQGGGARSGETGPGGFTDARAEVNYPNVQAREDPAYPDMDGRETYPGSQGRSDYPSTEGRGDVEYLTAEEKSYYRGSYPQVKNSYPGERYADRGGSGGGGGYPVGERYYSPGSNQDRSYHRQGQDRGYPDQRYREPQPYLDSVPADLTMASSSSRLSLHYPVRTRLSVLFSVGMVERRWFILAGLVSVTPITFSNSDKQILTTPGRLCRYTLKVVSRKMTRKTTKILQEAGRDVRTGSLGSAATLESLDDPAYRGLPDLGYSSRQTFPYILILDLTYLLLSSCLSSCSLAGSRRATTLSSWTRTCTPAATWTWSWRAAAPPGSWRRSRRGAAPAAGGRRAVSCLHSWHSPHRLFPCYWT